ncbi:MAG: alkaline phosphatase [Elusimicrobiales bacterium]|nr:alkaline phosphatase [Elusimicrobiales bacterium]
MTKQLLVFCFLSLVPAAYGESPRNVVLLIGDGMGPQAVGLLLEYARYAPDSEYRGAPTAFETAFASGKVSLLLPKTAGGLLGDSAALATELASGVEARPATLGVDKNGYPAENVTERAHKKGKSVGLVSDTRITHATPAGFAVHVRHRDLEQEVAAKLLVAAPEVMLSGGLDNFISTAGAAGIPAYLKARGKRKDGRDLLAEAKAAGYELAFDRQSLAAAGGPRLLGLFSNSMMPDGITALASASDPARRIPLLEELTLKALDTLSRDKDGFFLMVEAGQIDTAAHHNDAGRLLHEMLVFDRTLGTILRWLEGRDDTLLLVTADHETGGFSFNYSRAGIDPQPVSMMGEVFNGEPYRQEYNFAAPENLSRLRAQKSSFIDLLKGFDALPQAERTAARLAELVSANGPAAITEAEAAEALAMEPNPYRIKGHKHLDRDEMPKIGYFREFYSGAEEAACGALARQVSPKLNISWASGAHTATPFFLIALGHESSALFSGGVLGSAEAGGKILSLF